VRHAGGYEKTATAFAELLWAAFFRPRVLIGPTRADFHASVDKALTRATSAAAASLPGYKGAEAATASTRSAGPVKAATRTPNDPGTEAVATNSSSSDKTPRDPK
jgi:hypothetical protein